jgi:hypothetical protein
MVVQVRDPHIESDAWNFLDFQDIPTIASMYAVEPLERAEAVRVYRHFCGDQQNGAGVEADYSRFSTFTRVWFPADDADMDLVADLLHATFGRTDGAYDSTATRFSLMEIEVSANAE